MPFVRPEIMIYNVSVIINCNYSKYKYLEKYWNIELSVAVL